MADKANARWTSYSSFIRRFDWAIIILSIVIALMAFKYVSKISIKSDFKAMLPQNAPSVVNLTKIENKVRGVDTLLVIVGGSDWPGMKRFIDDFAAKAVKEFPDRVQRVEFESSVMRDFFDKNKYLFIEKDDLKEIYDRLKRKIDFEKMKKLPIYVDLGADDPEFQTKDIEDKYKSKTGNYQNYRDGYFTSENADLAVAIVWPKEGATNISSSRALMADLQKMIDGMNPSSYDPQLKTVFSGRLQKMVAEYDAIVGDILKTTLLCFAMVGLAVFIYYRRVRMGALMTINIAIGVLSSLAIAYFAVGYLTSQTAFLGSIIVGNGINYSLILMSRYLEERRGNRLSVLDALSVSMEQTWRPTIISCLTTSAGFLALMATDIQGFSQFGLIGGVGMPLCWISTYLFLPAWLSMSERIWSIKPQPEGVVEKHRAMNGFAGWVISNDRKIVLAGFMLTILSVIGIGFYIPNSLEYDFDRMKFRQPVEADGWVKDARDRVSSIFGGQSTTPSIVLANSVAQADQVCDSIMKTNEEMGGKYVQQCKTVSSFLPPDQDEKLAILSDFRTILSSDSMKFLSKEQQAEVEKFKNTFDLKKLVIGDLPDGLTRTFADTDGNIGLISYVYPDANLWDGKELIKFANIIREVKLPSGEVIESSGQPVILADLLKAVVNEGPKVTLLSFALIIILVALNFHRRAEMFIVTGSLVVGVIFLLGIMALFRIKLNFLNFVALPITFGIGVDYSVNLYQRMHQDGFVDIKKSIAHIAGAVILCSATTTIGYSVLMTSRSQALQSFGIVSLMGEIACLAVAMIFLTAAASRLKKLGLLPITGKIGIRKTMKALIGRGV